MKKLLLTASAVALIAGASLAPAKAEYLQEHRGGTMRLLARSAAGTLDPHINYTSQGWQMYQPIYDGLVTFRKAEGMDGFTVVADLAEALPEVSNDGKTFAFKLRKGIKFSTGQEVGVKDVVASFQRIFKVSARHPAPSTQASSAPTNALPTPRAARWKAAWWGTKPPARSPST